MDKVSSAPQVALSDSQETPSVNEGEMRWYVLNVRASQEKKAAQALEDNIKFANLEDKFKTVLLPVEEVVELKGGKRRQIERRFYPGYLFVEMILDDETWELINKTTRVNGFVGATRSRDAKSGPAKPVPLPKAEIDQVLARIRQSKDNVSTTIFFEPGEVIRIIDGPFNEFSGTVEEVNHKKQLLVVAVTIFGRSTPVEVNFSQVEKG